MMTLPINRTHLRTIVVLLMSMVLILVAPSCSKDDEWGEMPREIVDFVSQYYPGSDISSFTKSNEGYHVRIDNGPGMTFNTDCKWLVVDGYGMPLPQVMLFDQLPPKLYGYLQDTQQLDSVFGMERDSTRYTLTLLEDTLFYDIESGNITGTTPV